LKITASLIPEHSKQTMNKTETILAFKAITALQSTNLNVIKCELAKANTMYQNIHTSM
jgi:hypothetical protein